MSGQPAAPQATAAQPALPVQAAPGASAKAVVDHFYQDLNARHYHVNARDDLRDVPVPGVSGWRNGRNSLPERHQGGMPAVCGPRARGGQPA